VSPLIACEAHSNERRFFARSADVTELGGTMPAGDAESRDATAVVAAFNDYHAQCLGCVNDLAHDPAPDAVDAARRRLEQARRQFLRQLGLAG
jgi:hypothetical protein